jgi:hypothetical protein
MLSSGYRHNVLIYLLREWLWTCRLCGKFQCQCNLMYTFVCYYRNVSSLMYKIVFPGAQRILSLKWWNIDTVGSLLPDLNGADRWLNYRKSWIMRKVVENLSPKNFWIHPHILLLIRNSWNSRNRLLHPPPPLWLFHEMQVSVWHVHAARTINSMSYVYVG